jgi:3-deoxy-manno-octulosonate cytidylyltransferase (CMP-KDO synthetase)
MPRCLIIIPARLASTRLPGKLLLDIAGKPMLQHCWQLAVDAAVGEVMIATEDRAIEHAATAFGASVVRTRAHTSGTARIAEAIDQLALQDDDLVINLQGDEPLLPVALIRELYKLARHQLDTESDDAAFSVCTPLHEIGQLHDPNQVKVVLDHARRALLFSRAAIPWLASTADQASGNELIKHRAVYLHHGVYAYPVATLRQWHALPAGKLEQIESLEQLRLLENGLSISMLVSELNHTALTGLRGVDTAEDLARVRDSLHERRETR